MFFYIQDSVYIAAGDVRKRLSQQLTAPRKTRFNKDPDDPSGTIMYIRASCCIENPALMPILYMLGARSLFMVGGSNEEKCFSWQKFC